MNVVSVFDVHKTYRLDEVSVAAVTGVSLAVRAGRLTVIAGPSGSGKTTLLNLMGCIDRPDRGRIEVAGHRVDQMDDDALSDFRARHLGIVFQNFNLLPVLTAAENIEYPLRLIGMAPARRAARVRELLSAVGLSGQASHRPGQLSGGQRQRVAIARALAAEPHLVLADEPTANLDSHTGAAIIDLMYTLQQASATSFIVSSHDPQIIAAADDLVRMVDGRLVAFGEVRSPQPMRQLA